MAGVRARQGASTPRKPEPSEADRAADPQQEIQQEEEKTMSLEEKLALIDHEIRTLHQFCLNRGYNPMQIERAASPLFDYVGRHRRRLWCGRLGKVLAALLLVIALFHFDPVYKLARIYGRRASIQLLPYWDWTRLYHQDCLIQNPYYKGIQLFEEDCEVCETLEEVVRMSNISPTVIAEDYLKRDTPLIITDAIDKWPAREKFNIHFISELYDKDQNLQQFLPCMFASNVRIKYGSARALLRKAVSGEITSWYGHWENCHKKAAKVLRSFYLRPYFVPPMVEMAESNWLFVASHYKAKRNKPADIAMPMVLFAQLRGNIKVELTPRKPCDSICPKLYATLHEGETLVITDMMWLLDYMPLGSPETIAIGIGGNFD